MACTGSENCKEDCCCDPCDISLSPAQYTKNRVLSFDTNKYLQPTSVVFGSLDEFTFGVYFKTSASSGTIFVETKADWFNGVDEVALIRLRLVTGNLEFTVQDDTSSGPTFISSGTYDDGAWHRVECRFQNSSGTFTVDLIVDGSKLTPAASDVNLTHPLTTDTIYIGCDWDHGTSARADFFNGDLAYFTCYGDQITDAEGSDIYTNCAFHSGDQLHEWRMTRGHSLADIHDWVGTNTCSMNNHVEADWVADNPTNCANQTECMLCCQCIPKWFCLSIEFPDDACCNDCKQSEDLVPYNCDTGTWEKRVRCGSVVVTVTITLAYDSVDDRCELTLDLGCYSETWVIETNGGVDGICCNEITKVLEDVDLSTCVGTDGCGNATVRLSTPSLSRPAEALECDKCTDCLCIADCLCVSWSKDDQVERCKPCIIHKNVCGLCKEDGVDVDFVCEGTTYSYNFKVYCNTATTYLKITEDTAGVVYDAALKSGTMTCTDYNGSASHSPDAFTTIGIGWRSKMCLDCTYESENCPGCCEPIFGNEVCGEVILHAQVEAPGCDIDGLNITMHDTASNGGCSGAAGACQTFCEDGITQPTKKCDGNNSAISLDLLLECDQNCADSLEPAWNYRLNGEYTGSVLCDTGGGSRSIGTDLSPIEATCDPFRLVFEISGVTTIGSPSTSTECDCCLENPRIIITR